ncbi:unnamed protein product [Zymoseptoria tritici ST99CH_3D1]|uniref:F-box domain-containing protein n=3 Tax=Zymoseptoria tritici TaxID=1047171 RepID=F9XIT7_ZYMTI|nr:uncharacterized protein MYCGRDRAFT_95753 [Zymoseptoria tritici IPO323]EGP84668.1 hypothetical protein MYCGRDRAFT_95753 [Zymoseptoria tritici IPO323]SMR58541.1 unnamed protein product [Zymoseptoria tritici ST99CH_1E4]SMR61532.1 unnamed protein product [Zymoseptoria tritici ST99CH_3D1]
MTTNSLEELPPEICALIIEHLALDDIRHLRLVNRALAHNATQDRFRACFKTKNVETTREGLEKLGWIIANSRLGRLLEHLTLLGVAYDLVHPARIAMPDKWPHEASTHDDSNAEPLIAGSDDVVARTKAREDLRFLTQRKAEYIEFHNTGMALSFLTEALRTFKMYKPRGLHSLSVSVTVYQDALLTEAPSDVGCWIWVHKAAQHTFFLAMNALAMSKIAVTSLDVFGTHSRGFGLPCDALAHTCRTYPGCFNLPGLKKLIICISDQILVETAERVIMPVETGLEDSPVFTSAMERLPERIRNTVNRSSQALATMLEACPGLEILGISFYRQTYLDEQLKHVRNEFMRQYMYFLANMRPGKHLRYVNLSGLWVNETDLIHFLEHHSASLQGVELRYVNVGEGKGDALLSSLASQKFSLDALSLEDVWLGESELMAFDGEEDEDGTSVFGPLEQATAIRRADKAIRRQIPYRPFTLPEFYNPSTSDTGKWLEMNQKDFGDCL